MALSAINPTTGELIATHEPMSEKEVAAAVAAAHAAFLDWSRRPIEERARPMHALADHLREGKRDYARLMALEMGKPVRDGIAEIEKCAAACDFFADNAAGFLAPESVDIGSGRAFVAYRPLGVVLAVMPWNFPFWQVIRFAAPALMAGNAGVLKHSANVPGSAIALERAFREAGFPEHLFRTLMIGSDRVPSVIEHPLVRAVTLTGSGPAGRAVAAKAGQMLKKTVLELGGSDAYLVLEDADVDFAARMSARGRLINSGQSCIAAKRFIVVEPLRRRFVERLTMEMEKARLGDPMEEETDVGPMARHDLRDDLHRQVEQSVRKGARCLTGGRIPEGPGAFYPPTVLSDVAAGMPAYDEEMFGPVAAVITAGDEEVAVEIANSSPFGLGGGIFTRDLARGERIAVEAMQAGSVFVNAIVQSNQKLPFGGVKESGYGRELSSFGIREFVNIKTVVVQEGEDGGTHMGAGITE